MALNAQSHQEPTSPTPQKSYGNTTVGPGARVQLGDVSQDINIAGGVHCHLSSAALAEPLTTTAAMVQKLHAISDFLEHAKLLVDEGNIHFSGIWQLSTKLKTLEAVNNRLPAEKHHLAVPKSKYSSLFSIVSQLNLFVQDIVKNFRTLVLRWDGEHTSTTRQVDLLHTIQVQSILQTVAQDIRIESQGTPSLRVLWAQENIQAHIKTLKSLRIQVNSCLSHIVNGTPYTESTIPPSHIGNPVPGDDIVEIIAFNQSTQSALKPVSSILTRKDGSSFTLAHEVDRNAQSNRFREGSLIRYDLSTNVDAREESTGSFIVLNSRYVKQIQDSLYFREESDRRIKVKEAHAKTFNWIFEEPASPSPDHFRTWLENGVGTFWINGKAGSGKSTLMKYIWQHSMLHELLSRWSGSRNVLIASFFFWHAGSSLQKSQEGLLRSLLYQMFEQRPDLMPLLLPSLSTYLFRKSQSEPVHISYSEMLEALNLLKRYIPEDVAVFLMIDGIDEYSGDHYDFSMLLEQISRTTWIKILVSSRPIPACHQIFSHRPSIRLQDLTSDDMFAYIHHELVSNELFVDMRHVEGPDFAHTISEALVDKSSGVFLWLVLVVRNLLVGLGKGDQKEVLLSKIDELPTDLEALYDHMFSTMSQAYQREGALLLLQTKRALEIQRMPLAALQLLAATLPPQRLRVTYNSAANQRDVEKAQVNVMERRLRSRCCGFLEVEHHSNATMEEESSIQFLHRTVYDYVCDSTISSKVSDLCALTATHIDLSLLNSCRYMLERGLLRVHSIAKTPLLQMSNIFASCLAYSQAFNLSNNDSYVEILEEADLSFMRFCRKLSDWPGLGDYVSAYHTIQNDSKKVWSFTDSMIRETDLEVASTLWSNVVGLHKYFYHRVKIQSQTPGINDVVLIGLIEWWQKSKNAKRPDLPYAHLLKAVLEQNPVGFSQNPKPSISSKVIGKINGASLLQSDVMVGRNPWSTWLSVYTNTPEAVDITLAFVRACALRNPYLLCDNQIFHQHDRVTLELKQYQRTCDDIIVQRSIQEILKAFSGAVTNAKEIGGRMLMQRFGSQGAGISFQLPAVMYTNNVENDNDGVD